MKKFLKILLNLFIIIMLGINSFFIYENEKMVTTMKEQVLINQNCILETVEGIGIVTQSLSKAIALNTKAIHQNTLKIPKDITAEDYEYLKKCSVIVRVGSSEKKMKGLGSGTIIDQDEKYLYILTAKHVIKKQNYIEVTLIPKNGKPISLQVPEDYRYELENQDVAIVKVEKPKNLDFYISPISRVDPRITDKVYVVGHPVGIKYHLSEGRVSNFLTRYGNDWLMISAQIIFGNSGSPVYNEKYEVIGVVSGGISIYEKKTHQHLFLLYMGRAVKVEYLREILYKAKEKKCSIG